MSSFLEKLKRGMGVERQVETEIEEKVEEKTMEKPKKQRVKKNLELARKSIEPEAKELPKKEGETEIKKIDIQKEEAKKLPGEKISEENRGFALQNLEGPEGELTIDVYQTKEELVIQSAIAGVKPDNLDISIEGDMVLIRGVREIPAEEERNYFYQECYWGPFSRKIVLSLEVDPSRTRATFKEGVLTIRMPKIERERKRKIVVKD